jgi:hypothetical protein
MVFVLTKCMWNYGETAPPLVILSEAKDLRFALAFPQDNLRSFAELRMTASG